MGVSAESSSVWQLKKMKSTSSEVKRNTDNNCVATDEITNEALLAKKKSAGSSSSKKQCLCSPTTHPGSFRCSHHRATECSLPKKTITTQTIGLSRFARDVSQENYQSQHDPQ